MAKLMQRRAQHAHAITALQAHSPSMAACLAENVPGSMNKRNH